MALYLPLTKIADSTEMVVATGALIQAEGQALVRQNNNQADGVMPSTGQATDLFVGFSIAGTSAAPFPETVTNKVETFVVPTNGTIVLARTPISGQVSVYDQTAGAIDSGASVSGATISNLTATNTVVVTYKFNETVVESVARQGHQQPGGYVGDVWGQCGVVTRGTIYTTEFDASVNWRAATAVKLDPNGQVTDQTGSGVAIPATIVAVPGEDYPYLGLTFSAP